MRWTVKEIIDLNNSEIVGGPSVIPLWENLSTCEKFASVFYKDNEYSNNGTYKLSHNVIGDFLSSVTMVGYDFYTNTYHNINATIYTIKNFSEKCLVAVKFEETTDFYVYINTSYRPDTLEEFIKDLDLKESLTFESIYYDDIINKKYMNFEFIDVPDDIIWNMLFDNTNLKNIYNDEISHNEKMIIKIRIPSINYERQLRITEEGYIETNLLETGKGFYIGIDKVENFSNYIFSNYEALATIYK